MSTPCILLPLQVLYQLSYWVPFQVMTAALFFRELVFPSNMLYTYRPPTIKALPPLEVINAGPIHCVRLRTLRPELRDRVSSTGSGESRCNACQGRCTCPDSGGRRESSPWQTLPGRPAVTAGPAEGARAPNGHGTGSASDPAAQRRRIRFDRQRGLRLGLPAGQ